MPYNKASNKPSCMVGLFLGCGFISAILLGILAVVVVYFSASDPTPSAVEGDTTAITLPASFSENRIHDLGQMQTEYEAQKKALHQEVTELYRSSNINGLEGKARELLKSKERFPGGRIKLREFYRALQDQWHNDKKDYEYGDWLKSWHRAKPKSTVVTIAMADLCIDYAWAYRGNGFAKDVKQDSMAKFKRFMKMADEFLAEDVDNAPQDPNYYRAWMQAGTGMAFERHRMEELFDQGTALDPGFLPIYVTMTNYLLPRWYGSPGDVVQFAEEAAERTHDELGDALYAFVALHAADLSLSRADRQGIYDVHGFKWSRIQQGFLDLDKRAPLNREWMNWFCWFAVGARDKASAQTLFKLIGPHKDLKVWGNDAHFTEWKNWAMDPDRKKQAHSASSLGEEEKTSPTPTQETEIETDTADH